MNLIYEKCGDYLIPNLIPDSKPEGELRGIIWRTIGEVFIRDYCYLVN